MKKLLYLLTGLCLLAGVFTGCEKPNENEEGGGTTPGGKFASIQGKVTDKETGNPLSGVTIELQPTGKQVQTIEDGAYTFENLKAGSYTLKAQKDGYADYIKEEIQLVSAQILILDVEMEQLSAEFQITDMESNSIEELECLGTECGFKLVNAGNIAGEWSIEFNADWIMELGPKNGSLAAGDTETITFKRTLHEEDKETAIVIKMDKKELPLKIKSKGFVVELVYVEGGEFEMGATAEQGEEAQNKEYPVRTIKLDSYHIGMYEVTQAQWKAVMGTEPSAFKSDNLPVENVSWDEAQEFCKRLSEATGRKYTLPTEAQWEYAARGGSKSQHYKYAGSDYLEDVAWYYGNSDGKTHEVGTKKPNELGIYDMSGNVYEWISDWFGGRYDENDTENPQGPTHGSQHLMRGGCYSSVANTLYRISYRRGDNGNYNAVGFRIVVLP